MTSIVHVQTEGRAPVAPLWVELALVVVLGACLLLPGLGTRDIWDAGEARVAQVARQMLASGDWILPRMGDDLRLEKPPLSYWLAALAGWLVGDGVTETSARLPSALAGIGVLLLISLWGRKLYGGMAGFFAALMAGTSFLFWSTAREASIDMTLLLWIVGALACWWRYEESDVLDGKLQWRWLAGCYVSLALAMLDKGPVGPLLVLVIVWVYALVARRVRGNGIVSVVHHAAGLALFLLVALPWYLAVLSRTALPDGSFPAWNIWFSQSAGRFEGFDHLKQPFFFFLKIWSDLQPWTLFCVIAAGVFLLSGKPGGEVRLPSRRWLVPLVWFVASVAFFQAGEHVLRHEPESAAARFFARAFAATLDGKLWLLASFAAAVAVLAKKADNGLRQRRWNALAFPAIWALVTLFFFSIPGSKKSYYILPIVPALALCGGGLAEWLRSHAAGGRPAERAVCWLHGALGGVLFAAGLALPFASGWFPEAWQLFAVETMAASALLVVSGGVLLGMALARKWTVGVCGLGACMAGGFALATLLMPQMNRNKGDREFCEPLAALVRPEDRVTIFSFSGTPQHMWYCRRHVERVNDAPGLVSLVMERDRTGRDFIAISDTGRRRLERVWILAFPDRNARAPLAPALDGAYDALFRVLATGDSPEGEAWLLVEPRAGKDPVFILSELAAGGDAADMTLQRVCDMLRPVIEPTRDGRRWYMPITHRDRQDAP